MVLAMADETSRETLLIRVKEQGDVVRRLKAAKADSTQVSRISFVLLARLSIRFLSRYSIPLSPLCLRLGFASRSVVTVNHVPFTYADETVMKVVRSIPSTREFRSRALPQVLAWNVLITWFSW